MSKDLWPEFDIITPKPTPKTILAEVGAGLEKKTKGLVQFVLQRPTISGGFVSFECSLYSRTLGYMYPFLKMRFPMADLYPVELVADKMPDALRAANEEELLGILEKVFQATSTIDTIQKLIALS
jgi:hypothetical protein